MKITLSLSDKQNQHIGKNEILLRCSMGRICRLRAKSGIYTYPEFWNDKKGEFKSTNKIQTNKIIELNKCKLKLEELCKTIEEESIKTPVEEISREWLENVISNFHTPKVKNTEKRELTFFEVLEKFIETEKKDNNWKKRTVQHFNTLRKHMSDYSEEKGIEISFKYLDKDFFDEFAEYLMNTKKLQNSTNAKTIKNLKWFLRWALNNGYNDNPFFQHYTPGICKPKSDNTFIVFLNNEELQQLKSHDFSDNKELDEVRDVFLFCCYSGLRYSDVENLYQKDIYDDMLHVTTIKTDDSITINLNSTTRSILKKYKSKDPNAKALPVMANQKMNIQLKHMARIVGIKQPITKIYYVGNKRVEETKPKYAWIGTHTGRRTFICTLLSKGVAPQTVMKFTGHNSYETMKPYIDITESAKAKAMALLDE